MSLLNNNNNIISIISKLTNINHLKQLHAQLIHNTFHCQNYWLSLLITSCTRLHAPPLYTRRIFNSSTHPNTRVFTSIIDYYAQLGGQSEALSLFKQMQFCCNLKNADAFVYQIVIKSAGKDGILFHAHVFKLGFENDKQIKNQILVAYVKYGPEIELGRKVFDEMTDRGVADWNAMISGYWNVGDCVEACLLFNSMQERNVVSWTAMVSGFAKTRDLVNARRFFDEMPVKNVVSWNAMLSGYAHNGFAREALNLFGEMIGAGVSPNETTWVTVISSCSLCGDVSLADSIFRMLDEKRVKLNCFVKTALLDLYAKSGNLEAARFIFDELGESKNLVTWNAMISAYARFGHLDLARELFDNMPKRDVISWNSMIVGYAQNGLSMMAIELFNELVRTKESKPDEVTVVSVLSACGHLGALELGNRIVNLISEYEIRLTTAGYNSLIFMYSKCGNMKEAQRIFQEMETRDVVSYNTFIAGFAAHGLGSEAVDLVSMMEKEGIEPDDVTYISILNACSHAGLLDKGENVFESIKNPTVDHYACMVDLLGRVGKLDEAKKLVDSMPMTPHAGVYGSLLNAGQIYKRIEFVELAANKLFELEPKNSGNFVLLSNAYASAGRWKEVDRVRETMRKGGIHKSTGWSCVEYKGKLHQFISGDISHELSDDIHRLLAELENKMKEHGYAADRNCVLRDVEEEDKEIMVGTHSEKLAISFALLVSEPGAIVRVVKNLRVCCDCHTAIKMISKLEEREIIVRDNNRFHNFINGSCSCNDYW